VKRMDGDTFAELAGQPAHLRIDRRDVNRDLRVLDGAQVEEGRHQIVAVGRTAEVERRALLPALPAQRFDDKIEPCWPRSRRPLRPHERLGSRSERCTRGWPPRAFARFGCAPRLICLSVSRPNQRSTRLSQGTTGRVKWRWNRGRRRRTMLRQGAGLVDLDQRVIVTGCRRSLSLRPELQGDLSLAFDFRHEDQFVVGVRDEGGRSRRPAKVSPAQRRF